MSQQTSPFLEGKYGWEYGESGWNTGMDENLLKFSFMFDRNIDGIVSSLPAVVNGTAYFLTTDNRLYFAVKNTWYSSPVPKWFVVTLRATGVTYQFNGTTMVVVDNVSQIDSRLDAVETTITGLGTAAFEDVGFFASQSDLDVASSQSAAYTDALRNDLAVTGTPIIARSFQVVQNVAEAIALSKNSPSKNVFILGYYLAGDGGGGSYTIKTTGTANGGTVIAMTDGGFLVLCQQSPPTLRQFGCKGDYNGTTGTDDTAGYLAAVNTGLPFHVPSGNFKVAPIGPTVSYPGGREPNRTSAATLVTGQNVTGEGASSILTWGGTGTPQAFFRVINGKNITVSGISFVNGYSAIIVDASSDGSVDNVGLKDCILTGQLIGFLGGRQYALDPTGSKTSYNLWMEGCDVRSTVVHGMVATNCYRPRAINNNFQNLGGGFCIDFSQGCRGGSILGNTGDNVLHFCKVESSNVDLNGNPLLPAPGAVLAGVSINVCDNNVTGIQQLGVFLNSHTDKIIVSGNNLQGSFTVAISVGSVTGFSHDGQFIISSNIINMQSVNAIGIRSQLNTGTQPSLIIGNSISGGSIGIDWQVARCRIIGNNIVSMDNGISLGSGNAVAMDGLEISDNLISSTSGIVGNNNLAWKRVKIFDNTLKVTGFSIYLGGVGSLSNSKISNNDIWNTAAFASPSIQVNNATGVRFTGNSTNLLAGSGASIQTIGTATAKCMVSGNILTSGLSIVAPDASTTANTVNNITDAVYVA